MKKFFSKLTSGRFFHPNQTNILILVPLAAVALKDDDALSREDVTSAFVGNTVVSQLDEGSAYAFVSPDGKAFGLHPTEGRIEGKYEISEDGVVCVTWPLKSGEVENCDKTVSKGDGKYLWAGKNLEVQPGDPKSLSK
jgi:hypothetical protein